MLKSYVRFQNYLAGIFDRDDRGATAVEYGLLVGLIALAIILVVTLLGTKLAAVFTSVNTNLKTPAPVAT